MLKNMYFEHLDKKLESFKQLLAATHYTQLIIASGQPRAIFQDDMMYPFKCNPYFKEWLPLNWRPDCFLLISETCDKPRLYLLNVEDVWHTAPQQLPAGWEQAFEVIDYQSVTELAKLLLVDGELSAFLGEHNTFALPEQDTNPNRLYMQIDYLRRFKSPYEQACIREANRKAVPGHMAAYQAFMAGGAERDIMMAYLNACKSTENEMPYSIIAGLNEHAAVLHHFNLDVEPPQQRHSFLIDAGVDVNGYASDITRTYAFDPQCEFADMVAMMDQKQQEIIQLGNIGVSNIEVHTQSHLKVAEVLASFNIINVSAEQALSSGLTASFYPHGIGHGIGVNVHEKGGQLASPQGELIPPPESFPRLRNTTDIVATQVHTVEPGLYFIPVLLDKLKNAAMGKMVNWDRLQGFMKYGGIRIEDNIIVHSDGRLENLTRDAFADCGA